MINKWKETAAALDLAMENVTRFHSAQLGPPLEVQITEGVTCSRFHRAIERVGLYIPGGSAVLFLFSFFFHY